MVRVLVIEDEFETAQQIAGCLSSGGYEVDLASDGTEAIDRACGQEYAVMTVDRLLPGQDGLNIVRQLRDRGVSVPALIISALGDLDDRIRGLRCGGDDYLVKPFALAEMLARVDLLARRGASAPRETVLRIADLELDLLERRVRRGAVEIKLLPREFRLLAYLARNAGHVVSRGMLLASVWDLHFDPMTNIIDVYIGRLRRKMDSGSFLPLIHTVRGVGFCLRAPE